MIEVKIITKEELTKREEMWLMGKKATIEDLLEALSVIAEKLNSIEKALLGQSGRMRGIRSK